MVVFSNGENCTSKYSNLMYWYEYVSEKKTMGSIIVAKFTAHQTVTTVRLLRSNEV
jgi:hypothetical protein